MSRESYAFLTGLFVLVLGAALLAVSVWLGDYGEEYDTYLISTDQAVSGLNPESTVFYRGVPVGKVRAIEFDPQNKRLILIRIEVNKNAPITQGTWAMMRVQPLTGLAQVELNDSGENPAPLPTSPNAPARIPMRPSLFDQVTASGENLLGQMTRLVEQLNQLLDAESRARWKNILAGTDQALLHLNRVLQEFPKLAMDMRRSLARFEATSAEWQNTAQQVEKLAESARELALTGKQTSATLDQHTLPQLTALLQDLQYTSAKLRQLAAALEQDPRALLFGPAEALPSPGEPGYAEQKR